MLFLIAGFTASASKNFPLNVVEMEMAKVDEKYNRLQREEVLIHALEEYMLRAVTVAEAFLAESLVREQIAQKDEYIRQLREQLKLAVNEASEKLGEWEKTRKVMSGVAAEEEEDEEEEE